ncbi:MAG TPA: beta-ketoacyl synthase N-terminal-like domain-containing protein, partial [bacterium]|nr:beta-ketoacyl synthase N-terminal-like domain-containing protein [bacterium]
MREAVIVAAARTAVGKAPRGSLKDTRPDDMAAAVLQELLKRCPGLPAEEIDDVIVGCALPEGEQGLNMARIAALKAGLPYSVPAMTINRFCSSGLQSIALGAERILAGFADVIVAGGSESMSMVPMSGNKFSANPTLAETYPEIYISMGLTAENVAQRFHISREDQDLFAVQSHRRAAAALQEGKFQEETFPLRTQIG